MRYKMICSGGLLRLLIEYVDVLLIIEISISSSLYSQKSRICDQSSKEIGVAALNISRG